MANKEVWATIQIKCCRKINLPVYGNIQSIPCRKCNSYVIKCYSEAELSYYVEICESLRRFLRIIKVICKRPHLETSDGRFLAVKP